MTEFRARLADVMEELSGMVVNGNDKDIGAGVAAALQDLQGVCGMVLSYSILVHEHIQKCLAASLCACMTAGDKHGLYNLPPSRTCRDRTPCNHMTQRQVSSGSACPVIQRHLPAKTQVRSF